MPCDLRGEGRVCERFRVMSVIEIIRLLRLVLKLGVSPCNIGTYAFLIIYEYKVSVVKRLQAYARERMREWKRDRGAVRHRYLQILVGLCVLFHALGGCF